MPRRGWSVSASYIATNTHNVIRDVVENLDLEPNPDKQFISLSLGDPTTFGNLKPPIEVIEAIQECAASYKSNGYVPSTGVQEAKEAVAKYSSVDGLKVQPEDIILCSGCSCALDMCISALADPGQNVLIPRPGFTLYKTLAEGMGITVKSYDLIPERGWEVDLYDLESKIDDNTTAIIVINPSNPCGSVYKERHLRDILSVARRNFVPIIADEIYEHMVFPGERYIPIASLSDDVPVLSCSGITKRFLVPGWRMGWIVIHDRNNVFEKEIRKGLLKLSQRILGSSTLIQGALPKILQETPQSFFDNTLQILWRNAQLAFTIVSRIPGLRPVMPQGAMYMMVGIDMSKFPKFKSTLEFLRQMVREESVFCLPGKCFDYPNYMRLVLSLPENMLHDACQRIAIFCERHYKIETKTPVVDYIAEFNMYNYLVPIEERHAT